MHQCNLLFSCNGLWILLFIAVSNAVILRHRPTAAVKYLTSCDLRELYIMPKASSLPGLRLCEKLHPQLSASQTI